MLDKNHRVLISGDPIQDGHIFMFGRFRNMPDYVKSLEKLEKRMGEFDEVWPSHATIPQDPAIIPTLIEGAKKVLAGEVEGKEVEMHGFKATSYDLGYTTFLC